MKKGLNFVDNCSEHAINVYQFTPIEIKTGDVNVWRKQNLVESRGLIHTFSTIIKSAYMAC